MRRISKKGFRVNNLIYRLFVAVVLCAFFLHPALTAISLAGSNLQTESVIQAAYMDEVCACRTYRAFAEKAVTEGYPEIANLFTAMAYSESIHALRFREVLAVMGKEANEEGLLPHEIESTRKNLKYATKVELHEIDKKYPLMIQQIQAEGHSEAIRRIIFAWESEKQHKELLQDIQSGTGLLFGILVKTVRENDATYHVCANCGSTLTELPADACPICKGPPGGYKSSPTDVSNCAARPLP
jgi:rubrerythrin